MSRSKKTNNAQKKSQNKQTEVGTDKEKTPDTKEKSTCNKQYHKIVIENKEERRGYKEPIVVSTLILAVITLLLFIATGLLYNEASKAGESADKTLKEYKKEFEQANRPYVVETNFKPLDSTTKKPFIICSFDLINTGKFPATMNEFTAYTLIGVDTSNFIGKGADHSSAKNEFLPYNALYQLNYLVGINNPYKENIFLGKLAIYVVSDYSYHSTDFKKEYFVHIVYKISYLNSEMNTDKISFSETEKGEEK